MMFTTSEPAVLPVVSVPASVEDAVGQTRSLWYAYLKHLIDCCLAICLLVVTFPLLILGALAVKLTSRGPIVYTQTRLGRNGLPYSIYKIRTMYDNCEWKSGVCWSTKGDPRVTPVGRFLRATHIDELPQLWNVLRGDMSLVGPRPERPEFFPGLEKSVPRYRERLGVRPGITGLAQVQLPADTDIDSVRRKLAHDLLYIRALSLWLDLRILATTVLHVLGLKYRLGRYLLPTVAEPAANDANAAVVSAIAHPAHPLRPPMNGIPQERNLLGAEAP